MKIDDARYSFGLLSSGDKRHITNGRVGFGKRMFCFTLCGRKGKFLGLGQEVADDSVCKVCIGSFKKA